MKKGQIYEGTVEHVSFPNKCVVAVEGEEKKVVVKNALEGQKVRFRLSKARKGKCEGNLLEVLEPETIAGVKAKLSDTDWSLEYEGNVLNIGPLSDEEISPVASLPRLMNALRDGWLLEENQEKWGEVPCLRITVDQSGVQDGKILSTLWLRQDDGTPLRGEISVDGEIILTAEFTSFAFYDTIKDPET